MCGCKANYRAVAKKQPKKQTKTVYKHVEVSKEKPLYRIAHKITIKTSYDHGM